MDCQTKSVLDYYLKYDDNLGLKYGFKWRLKHGDIMMSVQ